MTADLLCDGFVLARQNSSFVSHSGKLFGHEGRAGAHGLFRELEFPKHQFLNGSFHELAFFLQAFEGRRRFLGLSSVPSAFRALVDFVHEMFKLFGGRGSRCG